MWPETQRCLGTALLKTLMILTPLVNFINILHAHFSYESAFFSPKFFRQSQNVTREKQREALLYEKFSRKMLMILTTPSFLRSESQFIY